MYVGRISGSTGFDNLGFRLSDVGVKARIKAWSLGSPALASYRLTNRVGVFKCA
jgi:hypothetical protein